MLRHRRVAGKKIGGRIGKKFLSEASGFSLLEVVLAVAILSITLTSMITLSATVSHNTRTSRDSVVADRYAREGVEMLRSFRDSRSWDDFRRIGMSEAYTHTNVYEALPVWGTPWNPVCSADRYYYMVPTGPQIPDDTFPYWAACGPHSSATTPGNLIYRILNEMCNEPWLQDAFTNPSAEANTTSASGELYYREAKIADRFWRVLIVTIPRPNEAFVRSVVCYQDGQSWRQVQIDGTLTNWR